MKPPVQLNRPTILNIIAIVCYCLAILFHIIAFSTNSWSSLVLNGIRWEMGLWQGCRDIEGTRHCTTAVFDDSVFKTGSDWHVGSRVMMIFSLVFLFLLEFALLGYACIQRLQKYKSRLVGLIISLSVASALLHLAVLIVYKNGVAESYEDAKTEWSYVIVGVCFLFDVITPMIVLLPICVTIPRGKKQREHRNPANKIPPSVRESKASMTSIYTTFSEGSVTFSDFDPDFVDLGKLEDFDEFETGTASRATSMTSLSEAETYKRFVTGTEITSSKQLVPGVSNHRVSVFDNSAALECFI